MTVDELRAIETFLDDCASRDMTLDDARRFVSARIAGNELHDLRPDLSVEAVAVSVERFFAEVKG